MPECSELSSTIAEIALNIGSRPEARTLDDVVAHMQKELPEFNRQEVVRAIVEATTGHEKTATALAKKLTDLKREARNDKQLRTAIAGLEKHLATGTLPAKPLGPGKPAPEPIMSLREQRAELMKALAKSEPALKARYEKQIAQLTEQLVNNNIAPRTKAEAVPMSKAVERAAFEAGQLRRQIDRRIQGMKPKGKLSFVGETFNTARAIMTGLDFSAVLRQGAFVTFGNPLRAAKSIGPMIRAFGSEFQMRRIQKAINDRPNAPLYARSKLYLAEVDGALSAHEEGFMSRWAGKIPGIKGSERAYNTFLNKLRADSFDAMTETLSRNGEPTLDETRAIANYINVATGRGKLGAFEQAAVGLNTIFFSPRYLASRFQLIGAEPLYGGTMRTRRLVAKEYGKFLVGLGVVYALGVAAGGEVETDPRSSDFAKLRFGKTRVDPLAGLQQVAVLGKRIQAGQTKTLAGKIEPIRPSQGKVRPGNDVPTHMMRFGRSKLSPSMGATVDVLAGKDYMGDEAGVTTAGAKLFTPMVAADVKRAMQEEGVPKGTALGLLSLFGMGIQTHQDDKQAAERRRLGLPPEPPKKSQ